MPNTEATMVENLMIALSLLCLKAIAPCDGLGRQAFAPAGIAHAFGGGGLDADAIDIEGKDFRDPRPHGFAVRADLGPLADQW